MAHEGRVGLVGLGAQGSMYPIGRRGHGAEDGIEAICDVDPAEAEIVLSTDPGVPRYEDYITMLGGGDVDAVVTCVPQAGWLADDIAFLDPTSLLITPDHYVNQLLHAHGEELSALGVGQGGLSEEASRQAFRILCSHWSAYRGTPVRFWLDAQLGEIFGVTERPSEKTADQIYDRIAGCLAAPEFKPRALYEKFKIEVLATTDDPCDDLAAHPVPPR